MPTAAGAAACVRASSQSEACLHRDGTFSLPPQNALSCRLAVFGYLPSGKQTAGGCLYIVLV